jgi:hypothetical protein
MWATGRGKYEQRQHTQHQQLGASLLLLLLLLRAVIPGFDGGRACSSSPGIPPNALVVYKYVYIYSSTYRLVDSNCGTCLAFELKKGNLKINVMKYLKVIK